MTHVPVIGDATSPGLMAALRTDTEVRRRREVDLEPANREFAPLVL